MPLFKLILKKWLTTKKQGSLCQELDLGNKQKYITKVLYRLTFVGSIFLAVIAILQL